MPRINPYSPQNPYFPYIPTVWSSRHWRLSDSDYDRRWWWRRRQWRNFARASPRLSIRLATLLPQLRGLRSRHRRLRRRRNILKRRNLVMPSGMQKTDLLQWDANNVLVLHAYMRTFITDYFNLCRRWYLPSRSPSKSLWHCIPVKGMCLYQTLLYQGAIPHLARAVASLCCQNVP